MLTQEKYADHLAAATMLGGLHGLEEMLESDITVQLRRTYTATPEIGNYTVHAYKLDRHHGPIVDAEFLLNMFAYGDTMQTAWLRLLEMLAAGKTEGTATNTFPEGM